jgi:hypothetical protein
MGNTPIGETPPTFRFHPNAYALVFENVDAS